MSLPEAPRGDGSTQIDPARIISGEVVTKLVRIGNIERYMGAAERSGFRLRVIAVHRQSFPTLGGIRPEFATDPLTGSGVYREVPVTVLSNPVPKGLLGIAIEKPEGELSHESFWRELNVLEQESARVRR